MKLAIAAILTASTMAAAAPTSAAPVELKFAFPGATQARIYTHGIVPWAKEVTEASGGTVEVKLFPGMGVATPQTIIDRVINGVADFGFGLVGLYSQQFPRTIVSMLPFETRTGREGAIALWHLHEKGIIAQEWNRVKPVALSVFTNISFHSRKPVAKISDFKGLRISTDSRIMAEIITRLGAAPVTMPPTDIYQALQRGTIDTTAIGWPGIMPFHLNEVVHYHLDAALAAAALFCIMNNDAYARLPEKGRATIDKLGGMHFSLMMGDAVDAMNAGGLAVTKKAANQTITVLTPKTEAEWRKLTQPVTDEWVKNTPDGAKILAAYRAETKAIRAGK